VRLGRLHLPSGDSETKLNQRSNFTPFANRALSMRDMYTNEHHASRTQNKLKGYMVK